MIHLPSVLSITPQHHSFLIYVPHITPYLLYVTSTQHYPSLSPITHFATSFTLPLLYSSSLQTLPITSHHCPWHPLPFFPVTGYKLRIGS
ncbi:hypothetical protein E2C01_093567 [Portunus trituberculatus]|uniref:Uncharacterized protein n=1 Tax=Portunus trituberculatus TaxID=210409 RepID=A0A5B7JN24_PORTR|nr:hypothetical protein [Portunus trituberculatus]